MDNYVPHIIFDVGRVLCTVDLDIFINDFNSKLATCLDMNEKTTGIKINGFDFLTGIQHFQDLGDYGKSIATYIKLFFITYLPESFDHWHWSENIKSIAEELKSSWNNTIKPCKEMIKLKKELFEKGYKIAVLSNMGQDHRFHIINKYPEIFEHCDPIFLSCNEKLRKPTKLCFYDFLIRYPEFKNAFYIDDLIDNLNAASSCGLNTYQFDLEKIRLNTKHWNLDHEIHYLKSAIYCYADMMKRKHTKLIKNISK